MTINELTGTPKQIAWAADIRDAAMRDLTDNLSERPAALELAQQAAASISSAKCWIDNHRSARGLILCTARKIAASIGDDDANEAAECECGWIESAIRNPNPYVR